MSTLTPLPAPVRIHWVRAWIALAGLAGLMVAADPASGRPYVSETGSRILVDNGRVSFRVNKSNARVDSLQLDGKELLGNGGHLYFDANTSRGLLEARRRRLRREAGLGLHRWW